MDAVSEGVDSIANEKRALPMRTGNALAGEILSSVETYIFQRMATETDRPTWTVPKLVSCSFPALPKW